MSETPIAVAKGDGIGPEIMDAALFILSEAGAALKIREVEIGEKVFNRGIVTGIEPSTWDLLRDTKILLKGPITTPQGGGYKSINVTIRTTFGLYANIRPCVAYAPFIETKHPGMDVVIVRENEEDLYAGIEYRQSPNVCHSIKLISRKGSEKIIRYAFEYARLHKRKKVSCFTKDNIMKFTDGLFHRVFDEIAKEYTDIAHEHWIVDIGAARLADTPQEFDVIVMPNLYGDILSDVAAQISGSIGIGGTANIGDTGAMFEAIHGSAPSIAGQNLANPSGLILASVMMLDHIGEFETSERIYDAWLRTIEEGIHTFDIFTEGKSKIKVGTKEFAQAVAKNLRSKLTKFQTEKVIKPSKAQTLHVDRENTIKRELVGVDIYIYSNEAKEVFETIITGAPNTTSLKLLMIGNRGVQVWPNGQPETSTIEQWRCRFVHLKGSPVTMLEIIQLLQGLAYAGFDIMKTENLYTYAGVLGFSS